MKKSLVLPAFLFLCLVLPGGSRASAKAGYVRGNFLYNYAVEGKGTWITRITPLSDKGVATLKIPEKLAGRKVVKLGNPSKDGSDIFGLQTACGEDTVTPGSIKKWVEKIKRIVIPPTVSSMEPGCFGSVPDGRTINIPEGIVEGLEQGSFMSTKWKRITVSPRNKKYKVRNGCLLSRDGEKLYGFVERKKTINIPDGVKTMVKDGNYQGPSTIVIPESLTKIEGQTYWLKTTRCVSIRVSPRNRRYAVKKGSLYDKRSGRLVAACIKNGVLDIPDTVRKVYYPVALGSENSLRKVIVPGSVREFVLGLDSKKPLTFEFRGTVPPRLLDNHMGSGHLPSCFDGSTVFVPGGRREAYWAKWENPIHAEFTMLEQMP